MRKLTLLVLVVAGMATPALCDPPSHAPAHGWRKKHDPYYEGYTGRKWKDDYGVLAGACDARRLGAELGAQAGAEVGAAVAGDTGEIIGTVVGVLIGSRADEHMGIVDRGCVGYALDLGPDDRKVSWRNPQTQVSYSITPRAIRNVDGRRCRSFDWGNGVEQLACVNADGSWLVR